MLLYVCLILLPATALAVCDEKVSIVFFDLVDANKDGKVDRAEADAAAKTIDINNDSRITIDEAKQILSNLNPSFKGQEDALFRFYDIDQNEEVNSFDVDEIFRVVDLNNDTVCSKDEFQNVVQKICARPS